MRVAAFFCVVGLVGLTGGASAKAREDPTLMPVQGAALIDDVDGDRSPDLVAVHCRAGGNAVLVASNFYPSSLTTRLPTGCGAAVGVVALVRIDRRPGAEIVVREGEGSADFAAIYTWRGKGLVRMRFEGRTDGWFAYGGGAAHDESADCEGQASGRLRLSSWELKGDGGIVTRRYLHVVGTTIRVERKSEFFTRSDHRRYRDFRQPQPFPSCGVDRDPVDVAALHPQGGRATLATFGRLWVGHTRRLTITQSGRGHEFIDDGCCYPVIDMRFQLIDPVGTTSNARVTFRVTAVKLHNRKVYWTNVATPRIGQLGQLRLRNGVINETVTGANYCAPHVNACGA